MKHFSVSKINRLIKLSLIVWSLLYLLVTVTGTALAQAGYPDNQLGPFSRQNPFVSLRSLDSTAECYCHHRFVPEAKARAYYDDGSSFPLYLTDTVKASGSYRGKYGNKNGVWIEILERFKQAPRNEFAYVFFNDLRNIEKEAKLADEAKERAEAALWRAEQWDNLLSILPYLILVMAIVVLRYRFPPRGNKQPYQTRSNRSCTDREYNYRPSTSGASVPSPTPFSNSNSDSDWSQRAKQQDYENEQLERSIKINHIVYNGDLNDPDTQQRLEELRRAQGLGY